MDYENHLEKSNYLLEMCIKGRLISLRQAAEKFECSTRTIDRMLARLRRQGHVISYDRGLRKFTCTAAGKFKF
ncbi:MAG: HTH domain-containing protein [Daejeonella sp.]